MSYLVQPFRKVFVSFFVSQAWRDVPEADVGEFRIHDQFKSGSITDDLCEVVDIV